MKTILRVLMAVMLSLALSSCGLFKRTSKIDTAVKAKASDSSHVTITKVDSSATNKTTIKEKVDTTVTIKGSAQEGSKELEDLLKGDSLVLDDEDQRTVVEFDSETQRLRARSKVKDRQERVLVDREVTNESAVDVRKASEDATHVAKSEVDATQHKNVSTKTRVGPDWPMWVGLYLTLGLGMLLVLIFYRRKFGSWFK